MRTIEELSRGGLRERLVEVISYSGYATRELKNLEAAAAKLGVLPEMILEARMLAEHRKKVMLENRHGNLKLAKRHRKFEVYTLDLEMPDAVYKLWMQHCEVRKITETTLLLSILHAYLLGSYEPPVETRHWTVFGEVHPKSKIISSVRVRFNISYGMRMALVARAKSVGINPKVILRALVSKTMEGEFCRPGTFETIKRARVFSDPEAYVQMSLDPRSGAGATVSTPRARALDSYEQSSPETVK